MGSNVNLGSFEVTEATVSRSVSRSSFSLQLTCEVLIQVIVLSVLPSNVQNSIDKFLSFLLKYH